MADKRDESQQSVRWAKVIGLLCAAISPVLLVNFFATYVKVAPRMLYSLLALGAIASCLWLGSRIRRDKEALVAFITVIQVAYFIAAAVHSAKEDEVLGLRHSLSEWKTSQVFYCKLPGDVDFLSRGNEVSLVKGGNLRIKDSNKKTDLLLTISEITENTETKKPAVLFTASGRQAENTILNTKLAWFDIVDNNVQRFDVGTDEIYLYLDDDDVMGKAYISIAKRSKNLPAGIAFNYNTIEFGSRIFHDPDKIMNAILLAPCP